MAQRRGRTDGRTDGKSPHSTGLRPLSGPLPKKKRKSGKKEVRKKGQEDKIRKINNYTQTYKGKTVLKEGKDGRTVGVKEARREGRKEAKKQVRIHDGISHVRWAGALMEVRSLFGLNSAV